MSPAQLYVTSITLRIHQISHTKNRNSFCMLPGLLIRSPWIDMILDGSKIWEIRGSETTKRGLIALIQSGTGTVVGVANLVDVIGPLSLSQLSANSHKAGFDANERLARPPYKRTFAWVLQGEKRLKRPVPYEHPYGAVIWVTLAANVEDAVRGQL